MKVARIVFLCKACGRPWSVGLYFEDDKYILEVGDNSPDDVLRCPCCLHMHDAPPVLTTRGEVMREVQRAVRPRSSFYVIVNVHVDGTWLWTFYVMDKEEIERFASVAGRGIEWGGYTNKEMAIEALKREILPNAIV